MITRRTMLTRAAGVTAGMAAGGLLRGPLSAFAQTLAPDVTGSNTTLASLLPTAAQARRDVQTMVDFGPRITGSAAHDRYIAWLEREFRRAGCRILPRDYKDLKVWEAQRFGLELLDGPSPGSVRVGSYYPRSGETPPPGVTGPLVYLGAGPPLSVSSSDPLGIPHAIERYKRQMEDWIGAAIAGVPENGLQDAIVLMDVPLPAPLTEAIFAPMATYQYWPGHPVTLARDYKRMWIAGGGGLAQLTQAGARGAVFIFDASPALMDGQYIPFSSGPQGLPGLNVDRDTGARLREAARARTRATLTLTATQKATTSPSIVAVLPGDARNDEVMIVNTHTDGQNFVEENGGVAQVLLARYFNSLPRGSRLKRTLVFSAVTGHMAAGMPQTQGFIDDHPDLVARAACAITMEHFGCTEWFDTLTGGYYATGAPETSGVWTSQTPIVAPVIDSIPTHDIRHSAVLRPAGTFYFGIGSAFNSAGVPALGWLAGPNYLVQVAADGCMDKFDGDMMARQVAWFADLLTRFDAMSAQYLKTGDAAVLGAI
jgi:hypothetical protein